MNIGEIMPPKTIVLQLVELISNQEPELVFFFPDETTFTIPVGKKLGNVTVIPDQTGAIKYYVSLGTKQKTSNDVFRKAASAFARWCLTNPVGCIGLKIDQPVLKEEPEIVRALLEGLCLGGFEFNRHKTRDVKKAGVVTVHIQRSSSVDLEESIQYATVIGEAVDLARDWSHEPANIINPEVLEDRARSLAETFGLGFKVIQYEDLVKLGAGGIAAVGRGSQIKPRLILLEYNGNGTENPTVLVGKAITFDTGGYSLKGVDYIQGMKYDKAGGVSVMAAIMAAARLKLKVNIVAIVPAAENMISGDSYRPDDILTLLSGKSVEIASTDAEGRLILADALSYAQKEYKPKAIMDIATLTGGVRIALGKERAGLLSNSDTLANKIFSAGEETGEKVWQLPLDDEYFDLIKSDDADMKNSGPREAQTIVGAIFLKQAVSDDIPWAHIDIAATGETETETPWSAKGANGFGVRLLLSAIEKMIE